MSSKLRKLLHDLGLLSAAHFHQILSVLDLFQQLVFLRLQLLFVVVVLLGRVDQLEELFSQLLILNFDLERVLVETLARLSVESCLDSKPSFVASNSPSSSRFLILFSNSIFLKEPAKALISEELAPQSGKHKSASHYLTAFGFAFCFPFKMDDRPFIPVRQIPIVARIRILYHDSNRRTKQLPLVTFVNPYT